MKAVGLFSGGLDSLLAIKVIEEQGIEIIAVSFISPFFGNKERLLGIAKKNKIELKIIDITDDYIRLVKNPKHGYGKNINPCIDCKIIMLKKAKEYAGKINAKFVFTGEVLGQRPMSQQEQQLKLIESEAGLKGILLRPLSAKFLKPTVAENNKLVDRNKLLAIKGRTREEQIRLAKKYKIKDYASPGGGCLLTYREYAKKLKDLIEHKKKISRDDIKLLKVGRHFRYSDNKIIVGRNEEDNKELLKLKGKNELKFEVKDFVGPITLLQGKADKNMVELAASLTARYSDADSDKVLVRYGKERFNKEIAVNKIKGKDVEKIRIK